MTIYFLLIGFIAALGLFLPGPDRKKRILFFGLLAIFLLLVLKKDTVGIDTAGYRTQYLLSAKRGWADFAYVYFEEGYILAMKLFAKSGLPFRVFAAAIYGLLCSGYYRFLKRYSESPALSLLMLACYQFLVFHTSALRQTLAMAVCLHAFVELDKGRTLRSLALTALAVTFHRSALVFFAVYPFFALKGRRLSGPLCCAVGAAIVLMRPWVWTLVSRLLREVDPATDIVIGGNCLFLLAMALFQLYTDAARPGPHSGFLAHMGLMAFFGDLLLSGSAMLRGNMLLTLFLLPGIPNAIGRYERRTRLVLQVLFAGFLILLFYHDTLAINQLDLLPYRFFWQNG